MSSAWRRLWATKSVEALQAEAEAPSGLRRSLTAGDLTLLGIGGVVGTGIFVLTGRAAAFNAGPAVTLSFLLGALAAALAGLCYAEMASMIPIAGSAYTYTYATLGRLMAFVIGWDLILEYGVAASTVSVGWSGYAVALAGSLTGFAFPAAWTQAPVAYDAAGTSLVLTGAYFNVPAALIIVLISAVLLVGISMSARVMSKIVYVKLGVIVLFVVAGAAYVTPAHWEPFIPPNTGAFGHFGWSGVFQGATMLFFAYCGFDAVSIAAQETINPQRSVPIGIVASLSVAALLYVAVSLVLTGIVPFRQLGVPDPMAVGIAATGHAWMEEMVDVGAVAGLTSVLLVQLYGQTRLFYTMAHDGFLPTAAARIHRRWGTPIVTTVVTGVCAALAGGVLSIEILGELTSIGTLFAYLLVSLGVMLLRVRRPDAPRGFRVPGGPYLVPMASAAIAGTLMCTATWHTLVRLVGWMVVGLVVYFCYGHRHAKA